MDSINHSLGDQILYSMFHLNSLQLKEIKNIFNDLFFNRFFKNLNINIFILTRKIEKNINLNIGLLCLIFVSNN